MNKNQTEPRRPDKSSKKAEAKDDEYNFAVIPPNGGWGWVVVICAFYCNVIVDGIQLTFGIFLKDISNSFEEDYASVALAGSLMFGMHLLMGPLCAGFSSVFGLRPVTIAGSIICGIGVAVAYCCKGCWCLYFTYGIIGGIGLGLVYMNTLIITGLYFTTLMPIAMGIVVCGTGVGTMVFAALGYALLNVTTWQVSFIIQALLAASMGVVAIAFKPLKPVKVKLKQAELIAPSTSTDPNTSASRGTIYLKREIPAGQSHASLNSFQNLMWEGYLEDAVVTNVERKRFCSSKCCNICSKRKRKQMKERKVVLSQMEKPSYTRRKSYVERQDSSESSSTETIEEFKMDPRRQTIYERIDFEKKNKQTVCAPMKKTIIETFNCRLLGEFKFLLFTVSGAVQMASLLIVYIYEKDRCTNIGFTEKMSVDFVIMLGGANTFWRLLLGGIANIPRVKYRLIAIPTIIISGAATAISGFINDMYYQFAFCILFGLGMASFAVFRLIILLELVGPELVQNATGINLLFMGFLCIAFPPFFGWLMQLTQSYNFIFATTGVLICIAGILLIFVKREERPNG